MKASIFSILALAVLAPCLPLFAYETEEKIPYPGFRPESELASSFVADVKTANVTVYPTIIRTPTNTTFSADSQQQIVAFLNDRNITEATSHGDALNPGEIKGQGQFGWFQNDMAVIGEALQSQTIDTDYVMVMEVLFPPMRENRQAVFGIHCIVLNKEGTNAFSFLLNSHHQMFVDADMVADDRSEKSRDTLIKKATEVGLEALLQQIKRVAAATE